MSSWSGHPERQRAGPPRASAGWQRASAHRAVAHRAAHAGHVRAGRKRGAAVVERHAGRVEGRGGPGALQVALVPRGRLHQVGRGGLRSRPAQTHT